MDEREDNPDAARRDFVPLEERLALYRKEEEDAERDKAMAETDNVVKLSTPPPTPESSPD